MRDDHNRQWSVVYRYVNQRENYIYTRGRAFESRPIAIYVIVLCLNLCINAARNKVFRTLKLITIYSSLFENTRNTSKPSEMEMPIDVLKNCNGPKYLNEIKCV